MSDEQTTGTPPTDDGDAAVQSPTAGTPNGDGRDAGSGEPDYKALYLASKDKIEAANRMQAELDELRKRADQPPADQDDDEPSDDPGDDDAAFPKVNLPKAIDLAARGDEAAALGLENRKLILRLAREINMELQSRDISDVEERRAAKIHFDKNRHRLGDLKAARAEIRAKKADAIEAENARLKRELEAAKKQPPTDVVRTHDREIPASQAKARKMTGEDFDREQAQLKASGKFKEAMDRQLEYAKGEIEIP